MNKMKIYFFCALGGVSLIMNAYAQHTNTYPFMTTRDVMNSALSNVTITNGTSQSIPVAGLFIASVDVNDCSVCYGGVVSGDNVGGTVSSPVTFNANQAVPIGQNYLYNMIYNEIYYIKNTVGSSPCSLPGCSWPGDDTNVHAWCITINAVSRHSSYTYSNYTNGSNPPANSPAYAEAGVSFPFDYKYDLINPTTLGDGSACIGPIVCDDKTLTCKVSTAQNQSFHPY